MTPERVIEICKEVGFTEQEAQDTLAHKPADMDIAEVDEEVFRAICTAFLPSLKALRGAED